MTSQLVDYKITLNCQHGGRYILGILKPNFNIKIRCSIYDFDFEVQKKTFITKTALIKYNTAT